MIETFSLKGIKDFIDIKKAFEEGDHIDPSEKVIKALEEGEPFIMSDFIEEKEEEKPSCNQEYIDYMTTVKAVCTMKVNNKEEGEGTWIIIPDWREMLSMLKLLPEDKNIETRYPLTLDTIQNILELDVIRRNEIDGTNKKIKDFISAISSVDAESISQSELDAIKNFAESMNNFANK